MDWRKLFDEIRVIAVVGYSDNPDRAGHFVAHYLADAGYEVIAVNPRFGSEVNGLPCYPNLAAIPSDVEIDVVDVFRSASAVPALVDEVVRLNHLPHYFWMQPGAENETAALTCEQNGITPVMHACMLAEHRRLQY